MPRKTIPFLWPCVCIEREPGIMDPLEYGMPEMTTSNDWDFIGKVSYGIYCPNCGRGRRAPEYPTTYQALKAWNTIQKKAWKIELTDFSSEPRQDVAPWKLQLWEMLKGEKAPTANKAEKADEKKDTSYEFWCENVMDERLEYLDAEEKHEMYLCWKNSEEARKDA